MSRTHVVLERDRRPSRLGSRAIKALRKIGAMREDGTVDWSVYADPTKWLGGHQCRPGIPVIKAVQWLPGVGQQTAKEIDAVYQAQKPSPVPTEPVFLEAELERAFRHAIAGVFTAFFHLGWKREDVIRVLDRIVLRENLMDIT